LTIDWATEISSIGREKMIAIASDRPAEGAGGGGAGLADLAQHRVGDLIAGPLLGRLVGGLLLLLRRRLLGDRRRRGQQEQDEDAGQGQQPAASGTATVGEHSRTP
jgi:hypothetical protein